MEIICREFVDTLIEQTEGLQVAYREAVEYWEPDESPVTTLFAALGGQIAEDFDRTGTEVNQQIFRLIEAAMVGGDRNLVTAVATGLIEAIIARAWRQEGLWLRILPMLGDLSRKHAEAWLAT